MRHEAASSASMGAMPARTENNGSPCGLQEWKGVSAVVRGARLLMAMLLVSVLNARRVVAKRRGRARAGWRTGLDRQTRRSPTRPARNQECHATDVKNPLGAVVRLEPGRQTRLLNVQQRTEHSPGMMRLSRVGAGDPASAGRRRRTGPARRRRSPLCAGRCPREAAARPDKKCVRSWGP